MFLNRLMSIVAASVFTSLNTLWSQPYSDHNAISSFARSLARENPSVCNATSIAKTPGGKDIWVIVAGTGDRDSKPGIAVVGGVEGNYLLGREISLRLATALCSNPSQEIRNLLDKVTFYIFPDVSPDASEQYFSNPKYERTINANRTDDDRDFMINEDPFEDLDGDGFITHLRVEDPAGKFIIDTDDLRIMTAADISRGLTGGWLYLTEGTDNDKDGSFNEDGEGGVSFNHNFTYDYEEFGKNAGLNPVSEPETKAVADFLYDHFNIFAVFSFGPQDNLGQPLKSSDRTSPDRRITSIMKSDETINRLVSDKYHEMTHLKGSPQSIVTPGNFMDWAYYHYGRYSFSTPGWWFPAEKGKNPEAEFLAYAEKNNIKDVFVPWKAISHPDFPGKNAETGGIMPFVMINPPADSVDAMADRNVKFLTAVASMHPELEFTGVATEKTGDGIYRLTLRVHNKGVFATMTEAGENNIFTRLMRISIEPGKGQQILSGRKVQRMERITGGDSKEYSWLIQGKGAVKVTAGAVNTGIINTSVELR